MVIEVAESRAPPVYCDAVEKILRSMMRIAIGTVHEISAKEASKHFHCSNLLMIADLISSSALRQEFIVRC